MLCRGSRVPWFSVSGLKGAEGSGFGVYCRGLSLA